MYSSAWRIAFMFKVARKSKSVGAAFSDFFGPSTAVQTRTLKCTHTLSATRAIVCVLMLACLLPTPPLSARAAAGNAGCSLGMWGSALSELVLVPAERHGIHDDAESVRV